MALLIVNIIACPIAIVSVAARVIAEAVQYGVVSCVIFCEGGTKKSYSWLSMQPSISAMLR